MFHTNGFLLLFSGISMKTLKISMKPGFILVRYQLCIIQSGQGHRDDRAKNRSKNNQRFDYKMESRGPFETFDI